MAFMGEGMSNQSNGLGDLIELVSEAAEFKR